MMSINQTDFNPYEQNAAVLNNFFKQPLVLILAITHIAFGTCHLISFVVNYFLLTTFEFREAFFTEIISIALYTPMAIGYVIVYIKSKDSSPLSGIKVLHIASIVKLVLTAIALAFVIASFSEIDIALYDLFKDWFLGPLFFFLSSLIITIIVILLVIIFTVAILFFTSQIRFFGNIKKSLTTININHKGSVMFAVMNIILATFALFAFLGGLSEIFSGDANTSIRSLMPTITYMFATALFIINAILALSYRKYINRNIFGYGISQRNDELIGIDTPIEAAALPPMQVQDYTAYADLQNNLKTNCPYCNAQITIDTVFCGSCGTKIK